MFRFLYTELFSSLNTGHQRLCKIMYSFDHISAQFESFANFSAQLDWYLSRSGQWRRFYEVAQFDDRRANISRRCTDRDRTLEQAHCRGGKTLFELLVAWPKFIPRDPIGGGSFDNPEQEDKAWRVPVEFMIESNEPPTDRVAMPKLVGNGNRFVPAF